MNSGSNKTTVDEPVKNNTKVEDNIKVEVDNNKFTYDQAVKSLIVGNCDNLVEADISKSNSCKDEINFALAFKNNDKEICKLISLDKTKIKCLNEFEKHISQKAIDTKNQELCLLVTNKDKQEKCISDIDTFYYDKKECGKIYTPNYKTQCSDKVDSDLFLKARSDKNPKICNTLSTKDLQESCLKDIEYSVYIDADNLDSCYEI